MTLHFSKLFVDGPLDGITYRTFLEFPTVEDAQKFIAKSPIKSFSGEKYEIVDVEFES